MLKLSSKVNWEQFGINEIKDEGYRIKKFLEHGYFSKPFNVESAKDDKAYKVWKKMLSNCFGETIRIENLTICEEWLDYWKFKDWWDKNYYEVGKSKMYFTKNIIYFDANIYSPETCCFVPSFLVNLLRVKKSKIKELYLGKYGEEIPANFMYIDNGLCGKYSAFIPTETKRLYVGCTDTLEELFEPYKIKKEKYIHKLAEKYKDVFPKQLYDRLITYEWKKEYNM